MRTYQISDRGHNTLFAVTAESYREAAVLGARLIHKRRDLVALRRTGATGMSGFFGAYEVSREGHNGHGESFHVREM